MSKVAELKAAVAEAEAAKEELVAERRQKRETLSKAAFRDYNEETKARQQEVAQAIADAQGALIAYLNNARQEILVGTVDESNKTGGTS